MGRMNGILGFNQCIHYDIVPMAVTGYSGPVPDLGVTTKDDLELAAVFWGIAYASEAGASHRSAPRA